ncbi:MAG: hypothetical protein JWR49_1033 [Tardiphaga sp.]|jgi:hypothetical protein|nr:hypothetical protein [Tardiphaga sp.]
MWIRLTQLIATTNGMGIVVALDAAVAVALSAVTTLSLRLLFEAL